MKKMYVLVGLMAAMVLGGCGQKMMLFNGKNLEGWQVYEEGVAVVESSDVWSVRDGVMHCKGQPVGYIRTAEEYGDYHLHLEWRWVDEPSNSGVLLHSQIAEPDMLFPPCIEAQLKHENAGDLVPLQKGSRITVDGVVHEPEENWWKIIPKENPSSEKPVGQWNSYDIICDGDTIDLVVNGVHQNRGTDASYTSGWICLQSEGSPIEFRNIYLKPLEK